MSFLDLSINRKIDLEKIDQLDFKAQRANPILDEKNQSERINRSALNAFCFRANDSSKKLFDSCVSTLTFDSPFYPSQALNSSSLNPEKQEHPENKYSLFTKKIENTPTPLFTLPPLVENGLTQRLSDEEFSKRKSLCKSESVVNFFAGQHLLDTPCLSLKKGMSVEQKGEFNQHIKKVNQDIHFRAATAPLNLLGSFSRKAAETVSSTVTHSVKKICEQNPINQMICTEVGDLSSLAFKKVIRAIPNAVKKPVKKAVMDYREFVEGKANEYELTFGVDKQYTRDFFSGALDLSLMATFKAASFSTQAFKLSSRLSPVSVGRIRYSDGYKESISCFVKAREFEGILKRDLMVFQYHSGKPLDQGRSLKWFSPIAEGNKLSTIEQVMDKLALLSAWGPRTHVTVAKIPAGERVKFLHGRAIRQISGDSLEMVEGGGVQYRFYAFDPKWILETRKLP